MPRSSKHKAIDYISKRADLSLEKSEHAYTSFLEYIVYSLKKNEAVYFPEFGAFTVEKRSARAGKLPNGTVIKIKSKKVAKFSAYKRLRDSVN